MNPQSSQDGGQGINIDASWLNQGGRGETGFHDQPIVVDGTSNKAHAACRDKSFLMKTELIVLCSIRNSNSCVPVASRRNYKGSYTLGNLRSKRTLTAGVDDTNSMTSSAGRSEISTRGYSTLALARAHQQLLALTLPHQQLLALCNLPQMNTEGVEHTKREDIFELTNFDSRYGCLFSNNNVFQQASFGYSDTSV